MTEGGAAGVWFGRVLWGVAAGMIVSVGWYLLPLASSPPMKDCRVGKTGYGCAIPQRGGVLWVGAQADDSEGRNYDPAAQEDEGPVLPAFVRAFWIQKDEVTAAHFRDCVDDGACSEAMVRTDDGLSTWGHEAAGSYPINYVTWEGARTYCAWIGGRLPTEAEWEFAARGQQGRRYPWGDQDLCPGVDRLPDGTVQTDCAKEGPVSLSDMTKRTPEGVAGLAGGVWEWTADAYASPRASFLGFARGSSSSGDRRVQKGGGWADETFDAVRSARRAGVAPDLQLPDVGFRCVWP